jgi:hypothetical protein
MMKTFDKLISSFVFDKFKGDWVIDDFLKTYIKKNRIHPQYLNVC